MCYIKQHDLKKKRWHKTKVETGQNKLHVLQSNIDLQAAETFGLKTPMKSNLIHHYCPSWEPLIIGMPSLSLPIAWSAQPQRIITPRQSCAFITGNMWNVYWIMSTSASEHVCPAPPIKVRLPLQRAWTLLHISGRACRRERGRQMCSIMWEEAGNCTTCQDTDACISLKSPSVMYFNPQV